MKYRYLCEPHGKSKYTCKQCGGSTLCKEHRIQKNFCKVCNPWRCEDCNQLYSVGMRHQHLQTQKHKTNSSPKIVGIDENAVLSTSKKC